MYIDPNPDPVTGERGSIYIADGYGNHRVVVFRRGTARWLRQWGGVAGTMNNPVTDSPGLFASGDGGHPHCVTIGNDGLVYVCDRADDRIQVFTKTGALQRIIPVGPGYGRHARNRRRGRTRHRGLGVGSRVLQRRHADVHVRSRRRQRDPAHHGPRAGVDPRRDSARQDSRPASSRSCTASRSTRKATSTPARRSTGAACRSSCTSRATTATARATVAATAADAGRRPRLSRAAAVRSAVWTPASPVVRRRLTRATPEQRLRRFEPEADAR